MEEREGWREEAREKEKEKEKREEEKEREKMESAKTVMEDGGDISNLVTEIWKRKNKQRRRQGWD